MNELKNKIDEYCSSLEASGWVFPEFSSGINPTTALLDVGLHPVEDVIIFFQRQNGIVDEAGHTIDQIYFFPGYYLISLEEAVVIYRSQSETQFHEMGLFPIFASGGGDYYLIDLHSDSDKRGSIYLLLEGYSPVLVFSEMGRLFETYKKCITEGVVYVDEGKYLELDDKQFSEIAAKINPEIGFWNA